MANGFTAPPRAYTREILTTAFNWLQTQPESVRTKATTPDALVSLYTQATNRGQFKFDANQTALELEAPVSSQVFMSDLKNLAEGLKEFDDSKAPRAAVLPTEPRISTTAAASGPIRGVAISGPMTATQNMVQSPNQGPTTASRTNQLNDRSLAMLREVQFAMNLSSETEALNLMIAVAHKNLKSVIA